MGRDAAVQCLWLPVGKAGKTRRGATSPPRRGPLGTPVLFPEENSERQQVVPPEAERRSMNADSFLVLVEVYMTQKPKSKGELGRGSDTCCELS